MNIPTPCHTSNVSEAPSTTQTTPPIQKLALEILTEIFRLVALGTPCRESVKGGSPHPPPCFILSYVCHSWREVTLCCPFLWTHIDISSRLCVAYGDAMLARSTDQPLRVSLGLFLSETDLTRFGSMCEAALQHISRIRRLELSGQVECFDKFCAIKDHLAPNVQYLNLKARHSPAMELKHLPRSLFSGTPSSLSCLRLERFWFTNWEPAHYRNLRVLQLIDLERISDVKFFGKFVIMRRDCFPY